MIDKYIQGWNDGKRETLEKVRKAVDKIFTFRGKDVSDKKVTTGKERLLKDLGLKKWKTIEHLWGLGYSPYSWG